MSAPFADSTNRPEPRRARSPATPKSPPAPAPRATETRAPRAEDGPPTPLGPPTDPEHFDSHEDWQQFHSTQHKVGHWHHLPLLLVALPPLGAIVYGRAENWTDAIILLLVCFYLYHLVRVPWDLYYASCTRRILAISLAPTDLEDPHARREREHALHALHQSELISLSMTVLAPVIGAYLLVYTRTLLSDPDRYINRFSISLFSLSTALRPLLHLAELFRRRALFYQETVHYPSAQVAGLQRKLERLEKDLGLLSRAFATKQDVRMLRDGVDIPLTQLSKAVRRYERKEEYSRLETEERFAEMEVRLGETLKEGERWRVEMERLKEDMENSTSPIATLLRMINHILGHRSPPGSRKINWWAKGPLFYIFLPINVSRLAIEWAATKAVSATEGSLVGLRK